MAGTFISFWNAPSVESPVVLNGADKIAFWVVVDFLEQVISGDLALSNDEGCLSLLSSSKNAETLDFSVLSNSATRRLRAELDEWRSSDHPFWSTEIAWKRLGGRGVSLSEPSHEHERNEIAHRSRMLGEMIFRNLVCAENGKCEPDATE
ncbi:MAG: hypothetical protein HRU46_16295 [Verrucomicrobiales bacterium]|nr:hypothetical protein [Verrucomicrobiales bacterium]